jgi:hypothetical protein
MSNGCQLPAALQATFAPYTASNQRLAIKLSARLDAGKIWAESYAEKYDDQACGSDIKDGFLHAFVETSVGGTGCPPPMPVSPLLSLSSLAHRQPDANAWYLGYDLGHASAIANGVDRWRYAPLDPSLRCNPQSHVQFGGDVISNPILDQDTFESEGSIDLPMPRMQDQSPSDEGGTIELLPNPADLIQ